MSCEEKLMEAERRLSETEQRLAAAEVVIGELLKEVTDEQFSAVRARLDFRDFTSGHRD